MADSLDIAALMQLQYGLYVVSSELEGCMNGQIATVVMQVTCEPNQIATCLSKENLTHEYILKSGRFGVSVLNQNADLKFIGQFGFRSGKNCDKFSSVHYRTLGLDVPLVTEHSNAIMDVLVNNEVDLKTHTLFIGTVENAEVIDDQKAMTYDYYRHVIKGKTQKNAPTFIQSKKES